MWHWSDLHFKAHAMMQASLIKSEVFTLCGIPVSNWLSAWEQCRTKGAVDMIYDGELFRPIMLVPTNIPKVET